MLLRDPLIIEVILVREKGNIVELQTNLKRKYMRNSEHMEEERLNYNDEPVIYCKHCLSLAIKTIDTYDYCVQCGSTNLGALHIDDWEEMYEDKHGEKYINKK